MSQKKISIREIANLSGVSVATVSRVINNNGRFSEATRKKVMSVIRENSYTTNAMAKGLRMQRSNTVGIVVPNLNNSFFADLVEKIEQKLFLEGYSTIICDTGGNSNKEIGYLKMLESKLVDGLILISGLETFNTSFFNRQIPIVCIDRQPNNKDIMYIGSNHYEGARLATKKLIEANTIPRLLIGSKVSASVKDRIKGFKDMLYEKNIQFNENMIISITKEQEINPSTKRQALRKILRNLLSNLKMPLGIFAISDAIAADLLIAAHSMFISIPEDLKVIGFDDAPIAQYCYPELTTVRQNTKKITDYASSYLIKAMQYHEPTIKTKVQLVNVELVNRSTV